jgi:hypothetical protein
MDRDIFDWPLGEDSGVAMTVLEETRLERERQQWGPAARALIFPERRTVVPSAPSLGLWRQLLGVRRG